VKERLVALLGSEVVSLEQVCGRGYTAAGRYRVRLGDGRRVFAKLGVEELTSGWLREEHLVYSQVSGQFIPPLLGWDDDGAAPMLVLPDYGDAFDAPPWTDERIAAVHESLRLLRETAPPPDLPRVERFDEMRGRWDRIAADPVAFLSVGVCSRKWLDANVGALQAAAHSAPLAGEALLHFDVRSDNIAFVEGRAILVDWNWSSRGNPDVDVAAWLPSLHAEGGPEPDALYDGPRELIALVAGVWASGVGLPPPPTADPSMRATQLAQLRVALPWASRALGLPPPDGG
jgi:hypothetical protein